MKAKQLQAKGGESYKHRLDPQTILLMNRTEEELLAILGIRPSQAVLIRRALRHYGTFVTEELSKERSIRRLQGEKEQLRLAAGRA